MALDGPPASSRSRTAASARATASYTATIVSSVIPAAPERGWMCWSRGTAVAACFWSRLGGGDYGILLSQHHALAVMLGAAHTRHANFFLEDQPPLDHLLHYG